MLYRFREAMLAEEGLLMPSKGTERPTSIMSVTNLKEAEHWRQQIFRDISLKITKIQNRKFFSNDCLNSLIVVPCVASLTPFQLRQLNDEINELIKEKGRWEFRVKSLGGKIFMVIIATDLTAEVHILRRLILNCRGQHASLIIKGETWLDIGVISKEDCNDACVMSINFIRIDILDVLKNCQA